MNEEMIGERFIKQVALVEAEKGRKTNAEKSATQASPQFSQWAQKGGKLRSIISKQTQEKCSSSETRGPERKKNPFTWVHQREFIQLACFTSAKKAATANKEFEKEKCSTSSKSLMESTRPPFCDYTKISKYISSSTESSLEERHL